MSRYLDEKKQFRSAIKERRKQLNAIEHELWSTLLCERLIALVLKKKLKQIKGFIPYAGEPNIWPFIHYCWANQIDYIVPKCEKQTSTMIWYNIKSEEDLVTGAYHILEPNPERCQRWHEEVTSVLVPALAFTKTGERIGYGGGYYDRFYEQSHTYVEDWIGIAFEAFLYEYLPTEPHDFKSSYIVTNAGIIECKVEEKGRL